MSNSSDSQFSVHRRHLLKSATAAGLGLSAFSQQPADRAQAARAVRSDVIREENAKPGTRDWLLTKTDITQNEPVELWRSPRIEGYCSATSVSAGEKLRVMVSTNPASEFSLEIFRTGYYGGAGGRLMKRFDSLQGETQPTPPVGKRRLRECQWKPSVEFEIPEGWLSGVYLGKLTAYRGGVQSYVIFIVRDDRVCDLLFQCSDLTWLAYNSWPTNEYSLYHNDKNGYTGHKKRKKWSTDAADTGWVSLDRPYAPFCQDHLVKNPKSVGTGEFLLWEFPLSYWLEQQGYDVSYISNVDTHTRGPALQRTKGFISVGHDEYWTRAMYDNVSAARDVGVNLAFLSGNSVWGMVPLLPSGTQQPHRVMHRAGKFLGEELSRLLSKRKGWSSTFPAGPDGALLMGGRTAGIGGGDWTCTHPGHWLYEGTGMQQGEQIPGLVGWEYHGSPLKDLPGLEVVARSEIQAGNGKPRAPHVATVYNGPQGNVVFDAGSIWWSQGLSSPPGHVLPASGAARPQGPDKRVQRMMANVFNRFVG